MPNEILFTIMSICLYEKFYRNLISTRRSWKSDAGLHMSMITLYIMVSQ